MASRLTDIVTTKLLDVREVFRRISPRRFSELLAPGVDRIAEQVVGEMMPAGALGRGIGLGAGRGALRALPAEAQRELAELRLRYVRDIVRDVQVPSQRLEPCPLLPRALTRLALVFSLLIRPKRASSLISTI